VIKPARRRLMWDNARLVAVCPLCGKLGRFGEGTTLQQAIGATFDCAACGALLIVDPRDGRPLSFEQYMLQTTGRKGPWHSIEVGP
jgi:predicted RNA-binding Zn-ribbon protein involved in translation (DUF1610 family)